MTSASSAAGRGGLPIHRRPGWIGWQFGRLLLAGSKEQAFLDQAWIAHVLTATPERLRRPLALRILALSPHYFGCQWHARYAGTPRRRHVLEGEFERNRASREEICELLLLPMLRPSMTVLDFGCGPGFLAKAVSRHVERVIGVDISRGVIACARQLNAASNITYVANRRSGLDFVTDESVDLVYSFAVFQHLERPEALQWLTELLRTLRPGATGMCHFAVGRPGEVAWATRRLRAFDRYRLRYDHYSPEEVRSLFAAAGASDVRLAPVSNHALLDDDIGDQHLVTFCRP